MKRTKTSDVCDTIAVLRKGQSLVFKWHKKTPPYKDIHRYTFASNWKGREGSKRFKEFVGKKFNISKNEDGSYQIKRWQ